MIQRIQTVWWLLSAVTIGVFIFCPVVIIEEIEFGPISFGKVNDDSASLGLLGIMLVSICILLSTAVSISLFRKRKMQIKLGYLSLLLFLLLAATITYFLASSGSVSPKLNIGIALPALSFIFQILAIRAVKKDEALIKSMDRLR